MVLAVEQLKAAKEDIEDGDGDRKLILAAIREQRSNLELVAKVKQIIDKAPQVNNTVVMIDERVTDAIIAALAPYPEARLAVSNALEPFERMEELASS